MSTQPGACPRCGAPYSAGQQYCLDCGQRLPASVGWTSRFQGRPWYPGDWIWPVLVFLLLAGLGALIAILATRDSGGGGTNVALPPPTTGGAPISTAPAPTTTAAPPTTTAAPPTRTQPPRPRRIIAWPDRSGYTIVLASVPTTSGRAPANAAARRALSAGLPQVGVLTSSSYASLQPGYYVVFSGVYGSEGDAESHLSTARSAGFASPYVKPITT